MVSPRFDLAAARNAGQALHDLPRAFALFRGGDYDGAAQIFQEILNRLPDVSRAPSAAALLGMPQSEDYTRLLARIQGNLGLCRLRTRRYEEAADLLRESVDNDPRSAQQRANLGVALLRLRRYEEAQPQLEKAVALGATGGKLHLDLAEACLRRSDLATARRWAVRSIALAEGSDVVEGWGVRLEAQELLAEAEWSEGRLREAEVLLRRTLAQAPGKVSARHRLVQLLARTGRDREAARQRAIFEEDAALTASIQTALASNPGKVEALGWVAYSYQRLGLLHLADVHYRQLLSRDPGNHRFETALYEIRRRAASHRPST